MLCDVYFLRREGQKLPRDRLVSVRGQLLIERGGMVVGQRDVDPYRSITAKVLTHPPNYPGQAAATLYDTKITRMDEAGFVLTGQEVVMNGLGANTYPQAWFCRPVSDPAPGDNPLAALAEPVP